MQINKTRLLGAAITIAAVLGANVASAASYVLTDGGSTARIDADSGAGMYDWEVSNQDQLEKQWFYYRTDSGVAKPLNSISASSLLFSTANTLVTSYGNNDFTVTISYILTGGSLGAGSADILETINVQNNSSAALPFSLFQYSNFDLLGTGANDTVQFLGWDSVKQTEGVFGIQEGIIQPTASYREAALTGPGGTLDNLANIPGYNLNDNGGPLAGDVTWAFQWDYTIPSGGSLDVYKDKTLIVPVVPEPASAAIILLGVGALAAVRRRKSL